MPKTHPPLLRAAILLLALPVSAAAQVPSAAAPAPPSPPPPADEAAAQRVEITGGRGSDIEQRRQSTAAKIVIGRDEIERFGDSTVGEVLRRLPGVTVPGAPGRGGAPRMRGLGNGYTQLLIDGQRVPPGFSIESLTPDQIERIEILRAPTAETGARAIAGTINIVTREGYQRRLNDVRAGVAVENGETTPSATWTHNDSAGALTYNLSGTVFDNHRRSHNTNETVATEVEDGSVLAARVEDSETVERRRGLHFTGRLQWRYDGGDLLVVTPTLFHNDARAERAIALDQTVPPTGAAPPQPEYDRAFSTTDSRFTNGRVNAQFRHRLADGARLETNAALGRWQADSGTLRRELQGGAPLRLLQDSSATREGSALLTGKLSKTFAGSDDGGGADHALVAGAEAETLQRRETRTTLENGVPQLTEFGDNLQASSVRVAAYAQDEWALSTQWAAHAGLRWEAIVTQGDTADESRPTNRSSVLSPLLHAVWKPDPKSRDQVRFSLTRSYRAPSLGTLIARPSVTSRFPVDQPNDAANPDRAGNPNLKPELATGVDVAVERYLEGGGLLSANVFARTIRNLMRSVVTLESVSYSPVPRWVSRTQNIGDAWTAGVELEAKFALDRALEGAPRIEMRGNLSLFRSRVASVPGPDNRLDQQPPGTANVGADYRFRAGALAPLTIGGNLNCVPGYETQETADQRSRAGAKRIVDVFALWTFAPGIGLRFLANNAAPRDYESGTSMLVADDVRESARNTGPTYTNWQIRLELKL